MTDEEIDGSPKILKKQKLEAEPVEPQRRKKGRPKGSFKLTLQRVASLNENRLSLPKTESQRIKELKELLLNSAGSDVVHKAVEIALNDEHPGQTAMIKILMDRALPVSLFEKEKGGRSAVNITISGIGEPQVIDMEDGRP